ncbi:MAG: hypothetical protein OSB69_21405 [Alphaproteobacteria bacterium]|nr:hypothetical protein [Alphaproteobacteria bacterium]
MTSTLADRKVVGRNPNGKSELMTAVQLKTMFGDFPITEAFKRGDFASHRA